MFRTQKLCPGSKNVSKTIFVFEQQNLFPQHMFSARLNWKTLTSDQASFFPAAKKKGRLIAG